MLDEVRFQQLYDRLGGYGDPSVLFAHLVKAYSQPHRAYHTIAHIKDCLNQFDLAQGEATRPDEVEAALWLHDAVYDPQAADNEEQSAVWVSQALQQAGVGSETTDRIAAMILATQHDREPNTRDCELLLDIDLSILGREPEKFADYDRSIRAEYSHVPEEHYCIRRAALLEGFLKRPTIYRTAFFRARLEAQARENLAGAIARLREKVV